MTELQYERWKDFAIRMAKYGFTNLRQRPSKAWVLDAVEDFFGGLCEEDVCRVVDWDSDPYPCDMVTEHLDHPRGYSPWCKACDWRSTFQGECRCNDIEEHFYYQWDDQWGSPVRCCIRAGLDMASSPSAGVFGFTAGDLRRMYPEGVPEWIFPPGERLHYWLTDKLNGTFAELPDDAGIVL